MRDRILCELAAIGRDEGVRVFYAVESGSRAWGFASPESDYDPRFLYVHPPEWYCTPAFAHARDVIERPPDGVIDLSGWDLRKTLVLLARSNPPLLEWLWSPVVYVDRYGVEDRLRETARGFFSHTACRRHYLHMAVRNVRKYLGDERVDRGRYFYALRPLLAVRWLDEGRGIVPMEFSLLLEMAGEPGLRAAVGDLLRRKRRGEDLTDRPHIPVIRDFISREIARLSAGDEPEPEPARDNGMTDALFREIMAIVWGT